MFKRVIIVALVVAAFLVLAVPALAWNGYRQDYTTSAYCSQCHMTNGVGPAVYERWTGTKHGLDEEAAAAAHNLPYGSVCAGCHTANYDPRKVTPSPSYSYSLSTPLTATSTPTATSTSWAAAPWSSDAPAADSQDDGISNMAWSEYDIGCSSCHYGASTGVGSMEKYGNDPNNTAHNAPYGLLASAEICGACHSRYSYTVNTIPVTPVPDAATPTPSIQPQMAIGYNMLGTPIPGGWNPASLAASLNVAYPGWTPTPTATSFGYYPAPLNTGSPAPGLMMYWKLPTAATTSHATGDVNIDTKWQLVGHDGSAAQYSEWQSEGHANALTALTSEPFWASFPEATKQQCLECHSADFRIMKEAGKNPTSADAQYGITCVGCHTPHDAGTVKGVWDEAFDAQLIGDSRNMCTDCHNAELPVNTQASPGADVHHPMKEMMDGYGAIDVAAFPSVHKGKCIQCHMVPTSYSRGSAQLGGNHTFEIVMPEVANAVLPIAVATTNSTSVATPVPTTTVTPLPLATVTTITKTVTQDTMPYSACSTCHNNDQKPTPVPVSTTTTLATPAATPTKIMLTVVQNIANQGDKAEWLQATIDQRQSWSIDKIAEIHTALNAAAVRLGYADEAAAQKALVAIAAADRTASQTEFLKAYTNVQFADSEGSYGIHNWDYTRQILNTALWEAQSVTGGSTPTPPPATQWSVTFKASKTSVKKNTKVKFSGTVAPAEMLKGGGAQVIIQKKSGSSWATWKTVTCNLSGAYSISVKMTSTLTLRAYMPSYDASTQIAGNSGSVKVTVKKK